MLPIHLNLYNALCKVKLKRKVKAMLLPSRCARFSPLCRTHGARCCYRRSRPPHRRSYMETTGHIKKLLPHEKLLILDTGTRLPVEDIVNVTV